MFREQDIRFLGSGAVNISKPIQHERGKGGLCPHCGGGSKVTKTIHRNGVVERYRECLDCKRKFGTVEKAK